ncbi:MAG: type VI secretion system lipoprotein TssJ [Pseudomonadota bacterium]
MRKYVAYLIIFLLPLLLCACSTLFGSKEQAKKVTVMVNSTATVNPDSLGQNAPIAVTFYQLSKENAFMKANYNDLNNNSNKVLGDTLIEKTTWVIPAGTDNKKFSLTIQPGCHTLGIVAAYRDLSNKTWKTTLSCHAAHSGVNVWVNAKQLLVKKREHIDLRTIRL